MLKINEEDPSIYPSVHFTLKRNKEINGNPNTLKVNTSFARSDVRLLHF